jgi:hypothetical protein
MGTLLEKQGELQEALQHYLKVMYFNKIMVIAYVQFLVPKKWYSFFLPNEVTIMS